MIATIAAWALKNLGFTGIALGAVLLFYEGLSPINFWPVNKLPWAGWVVEGEVARRVRNTTESMISAAEKARLTAERDLARRLARQNAEAAVRETNRAERLEEARAALTGRLTALTADREALSDELNDLLSRPQNPAGSVDGDLMRRLRNR